MDKSFHNKEVDNAEVRSWSEETQRKKGDSLTEDYISVLPEVAPVSLKQNDLQELREIWESWNSDVKYSFWQKYGDIALLLYVKVNEPLIKALIQFWNPAYSCFSFNKEDMIPTLEEYTSLFHFETIHLDRIYSKASRTQSFKSKLARITGMGENDIKKSIEMFALGIYGLMIFPKVLYHVEAAVIDLFERLERKVNPVSTVLAETFRALSSCRRAESSRFTGKDWVSLFRNLQEHDIVWRVPWLAFVDVLYKCGDSDWVTLLGLWGGVGYAPLMVLRQFGARQFIPATSGLKASEFVYCGDHYKKTACAMSEAWKSTFRTDFIAAEVMLTPDYMAWRAVRKNDILPLADRDQTIPLEAQFKYVPSKLEILKSEFEAEIARKEAECEALRQKNFMLDIDRGFYNTQFELMRKRKDEVEANLTSLQSDYQKMSRARRDRRVRDVRAEREHRVREVETEKKKRNQELESERRSWVRALKSERTEAKELRQRYTLSKKREEELHANIEELRMKTNNMQLELERCGAKNERIEVLNQEMHEMESRHEEELARAKAKNEEYSAYVMQLESSLSAENSQRCPVDQRVSLEENAALQKKIHDLEAALRSCQTQIAGLKHTVQGTRLQWQNSNDHFRDWKTNVNHVIRETMNQLSGIARQLREMDLQAKVIQSYTNPASGVGKRVDWLVNQIVELNIRARPFLILGNFKHHYNTRKAMDDKIAQIERTQLQLQDDLRKMQEDMLKAQEDMLSKLANILGGRNPEHGKAHEQTSEEPLYPPGFTPVQSPNIQETSIHTKVHINPDGIAVNPQPGSCSHPEESPYHQVPDLDEEAKKSENKLLQEQYKQLANEVQAMKEDTSLYGIDAKELSLVPDLVLPPKFKTPDFEKYDGTQCPSAHITMFCRKMTGYVGDDQLLIHCFQESLYKHMKDVRPNRMVLQAMEKKHSESFRQYAQRWREVAVQVHPPLVEDETNLLFVNTLKAPFFSHFLGNPSRSFADIVTAGEMIEMAIKSGKLEGGDSSKKQPMRKKENKVSNVRQYDSHNITVSRPQGTVASPQIDNRQWARDPRRERPQFDPILMTYKELFHELYDRHVVSPYHVDPIQPPYPKWYDVSAKCEYHAGVSGHSIENCPAFKKVIQALRRRNVINFGDSEQPNIAQNLLPNHAGAGINAVAEEKGRMTVKNISEVMSPMSWVWCQMVKVGLLKTNLPCEQFNNEEMCHLHNCTRHSIQQCSDFLGLVQEMMDSKEIEFFKEVAEKEEAEVYASEGSSKGVYSASCPLVITPKNRVAGKVAPKVIITPPSPFPYKDNKRVPWRYTCQIGEVTKQQEEVDEVGHMTRSGRCYHKEPEKKIAVEKGKSIDVQIREDEPIVNEPVTENEAMEFLKFLKHSEYSIVEQLHKLLARISVLSLLLSSEAHRNALLKVLNQTFVSKEIPTEKLDRLVANIQADNFLSFSEDEIPSGMIGNHKALHITVRCKGHVLSRVLIDNGSALNVMPLVTLKKLPVDSTLMRSCQSVVRAFDGTKREVLGKINIPLTIGPAIYEVEFLVMDIMPTYNCLLGRPWIHQAGAVPSTLYQRIKFAIDGRLICIHAEEDIIASVSTTAPYVEVEEQAVECSFRSLEYVNAMFVAEGKKIPKPRLSNCTKMGLKLTLGRGAKTGKGFGRRLQGLVGPIYPVTKRDRFGLGYQPTLKKTEKHQEDSGIEKGKIDCKVIVENALEDLGINVITDEEFKEMRATSIYPAPLGFVLNNWTAEELPVVYKSFAENSDINNTNANDSDPEIDFEMPMSRGNRRKMRRFCLTKSLQILNLGTDEDRKEDVFAWSYEDMPGLDRELVVHKLPIKPDLAKYPEWVAILSQYQRRMGRYECVSTIEMNRASPKDNFLATYTLVDNTAGNSLFSFMDGFSGYNQIKMYPEDMEKTTFVTMWGTFCYKVMPFGLKNAGATYQRAMVTFHDMMHKEIEVYVDDMSKPRRRRNTSRI
ncbi:hypothetical protein F3Y22_tig00110788pilonHSYRG00276 [Hibiscus syriacus]|uniref:G-patch domain-containing protein n=1 Tax=Hibiscus syriacus TaxID=106335 RepID=A0A6A2ZRB2_HIBSY|nr:hypothetical protein F3Y22_tig00110788pilonHSYRG00276 [Hibiscus syriacus]